MTSTPGTHTGILSRTTGYLTMPIPAAGDLAASEDRLTFEVTPGENGTLTLLHVLPNKAKLAWGKVSADRKSWEMWSGVMGVSIIKLSGTCGWDAGRRGFVLTETGYAVREWAALLGEAIAA